MASRGDLPCAGAGWLARVGSCCFLCMQVLMLLDFVVTWNNAWVDMEDERYALALPVPHRILLSTGAPPS